MPQLGVDYANTDSINKPGVAGFTKAKQAGARIIIPRAVYGRAYAGQSPVYLDAYWARDCDDIIAAGLIRSAYLFLCVPRKGWATPEPEVQVDSFIKYLGGKISGPCEGHKQTDMVPFFDVEEHSDILTPNQYYDWVLRAAKKLREHFGAWPGMYTSNRVWQEELKGHLPGQLLACPLWLAKPWPVDVNQPVILSGVPNMFPIPISQFGDKTNWVLYQYQGDGKGMPGFSPGAVDMNRSQFVKQGMKGNIVQWIQARAGGGLKVDGDFGTKTNDRIRELQALYALDADGIVGTDTFALLSWLNPAPL
jgi:peptidoglycan hydrolase-like protein with peptidoglycan-binding domain